MNAMNSRRAGAVGLIASFLALSACSTDAGMQANEHLVRAGAVSGSYSLPDDARASHAIAIAQARHEHAATVSFERTLSEALPNQEITVNGRALNPTRGVIIGRIVDVSPGAAYTVVGDDAESGTQVRFDHPDAVWRIATVTVAASHHLTTSGDLGPNEVRFGAFISADGAAEEQMKGIANLGDVIVVLDPERTYGYDKGVPWVARSGALLGDIDDRGIIGFPALGLENEGFVDLLTTVDKVLAQAARRPVPLAVTVNESSGKVTWLPATLR